MTMTRTDVHRPTEIRPEDYEWRRSYDTQPPTFMGYGGDDPAAMRRAQEEFRAILDAWFENFDRFVREPIRESKATVYGSPNKCDHCGANLRYGNLYFHRPSGGVIVVGDICAEETLEVPDRARLEQKRLREAAAAARHREAESKAARERLDALEEWAGDFLEFLRNYGGENEFILDVRERVLRKGYLSQRQVDAVWRANERDIKRAEQKAREAEMLASGEIQPVPVSDERQKITGEIVKSYWKEYGMDSRHVMIVRDDRGFKVWGSVPRNLDGDAGDRVEFMALIERSDRNETFGFFKHPTKAKVIS